MDKDIDLGYDQLENVIEAIKSDPDSRRHIISLWNPNQLKDYVKEIRKIEKYLGSFEKKLSKAEVGTRKSLQKCLVANFQRIIPVRFKNGIPLLKR